MGKLRNLGVVILAQWKFLCVLEVRSRGMETLLFEKWELEGFLFGNVGKNDFRWD
jgi:hypothetical protein